jgi:hypothetical protein
MKKKTLLPCVVFVSLIILVVSSAQAFFSFDIRKAKKFMSAGMYPQAIELLNKRINEKPTDAEAHYQLGTCYVNTGNFSKAEERFASAVRLKPDYGFKIGGEYQKAAKLEAEKEPANCDRVYNLLTHAYAYDPHLATDTESKLIDYGDQAREQKKYACAEKFYRLADRYSKKNIKKTTAHRYLYLAALGYHTETLKAEAEPVLGKDFVNKVIPCKAPFLHFEGTYSDVDIVDPDNDGGWIIAIDWSKFDWSKVGRNASIVIEGKVPKGCEPVYYHRGKKFKQPFVPIADNNKVIPIQERPTNGEFIIWMQKGKNIKATVKVVEQKTLPPKLELLNDPE